MLCRCYCYSMILWSKTIVNGALLIVHFCVFTFHRLSGGGTLWTTPFSSHRGPSAPRATQGIGHDWSRPTSATQCIIHDICNALFILFFSLCTACRCVRHVSRTTVVLFSVRYTYVSVCLYTYRYAEGSVVYMPLDN